MCNFDVSEGGREDIAVVMMIGSTIQVLFGLVFICFGAVIKVNLDDKLHLMEEYDADFLPAFLLTVGFGTLLTNILLAKVSFDCRDTETQYRWQNYLNLLVAYLFIAIWFIFAASMLCFSHRIEIEEGMETGITGLMRNYHEYKESKTVMDTVQLQFQCCGNKGYNDWTKIHWISTDHINMTHPEIIRQLKDGNPIIDDVPFSCCSPFSKRPCVHHAIHNKSRHINFDKEVTLSKAGCTGKLMIYFEDVLLNPAGFTILASFFLQVTVLILLRLLQTSISSACELGDPFGDGVAYVCPNCPVILCGGGDPVQRVNQSAKHKRRKRHRSSHGDDSKDSSDDSDDSSDDSDDTDSDSDSDTNSDDDTISNVNYNDDVNEPPDLSGLQDALGDVGGGGGGGGGGGESDGGGGGSDGGGGGSDGGRGGGSDDHKKKDKKKKEKKEKKKKDKDKDKDKKKKKEKDKKKKKEKDKKKKRQR